jgi:hypothetical protein
VTRAELSTWTWRWSVHGMLLLVLSQGASLEWVKVGYLVLAGACVVQAGICKSKAKRCPAA